MDNAQKCSSEPVAKTATTTPANAGPHEVPAGIPAQSTAIDEELCGSRRVTELPADAPGLKCLLSGLVTGDQPVYTSTGPRTAKDLAESEESFVCLVHDPALGRYAAREAWVIPAGEGRAFAVTANGDTFMLGAGSFFEFAHRGRIPIHLAEGRRILACTTYKFSEGYVRVNLRDGTKGKESLHRLVAQDVLGHDIVGRVVHHKDHDKLNNAPENLEVLSDQSAHATLHNQQLVDAGEHPFQLNTYPKAGAKNPMHQDGDFWSNPKKAKRYRAKKREEMIDRDPIELQKSSVRRRTLNIGHRIRNAGHTFSTMEEYIEAQETVLGRIANKEAKRASIRHQFGSIEGFIAALDAENHHVQRVEPIGVQPLYSIVVSSAGGDSIWTPPVVIWPVGSTSPYGSGIVINT